MASRRRPRTNSLRHSSPHLSISRNRNTCHLTASTRDWDTSSSWVQTAHLSAQHRAWAHQMGCRRRLGQAKCRPTRVSLALALKSALSSTTQHRLRVARLPAHPTSTTPIQACRRSRAVLLHHPMPSTLRMQRHEKERTDPAAPLPSAFVSGKTSLASRSLPPTRRAPDLTTSRCTASLLRTKSPHRSTAVRQNCDVLMSSVLHLPTTHLRPPTTRRRCRRCNRLLSRRSPRCLCRRKKSIALLHHHLHHSLHQSMNQQRERWTSTRTTTTAVMKSDLRRSRKAGAVARRP